MEAFWLVISLLLHLFSFLLIVLLFLRLSRLKEAEARAAELEEAMAAQLALWKEENDRFLAELDRLLNNKEASAAGPVPPPTGLLAEEEPPAAMSAQQHGQPAKRTEEGAALPRNGERGAELGRTARGNRLASAVTDGETERQPMQAGAPTNEAQEQEEREAPSDFLPIDAIEDVLDLSPLAQSAELVLRRYEQGATVEELAKQLGKGKTEVELLLKFARKTSQ
ncbi:hypothetical protein ACPVTF_07010 [Geobacillus icigianus]|uniref:Swarming motility protein SwrB n=1 Tax=Geobacillus subterraneus TaxID=129338 RepID=A0A679FJS7_9BACL|nr:MULTISPECIES: hypothetical protein [Geobacillus]KYD23773.1 hypothetical protein B4113_3138 [Geobacillus sp. B4113_201601]BBW96662.1 hypothetical protein GsuE55_14950 [Geobacillus subterraneus]